MHTIVASSSGVNSPAPSPRILTIQEVVTRTTLCKTVIYSLIKEGTFPPSRDISSGRVGWLESEIDDWILQKFQPQSSAA